MDAFMSRSVGMRTAAVRAIALRLVRERWVKSRTALVNQIRGLLLERGITMRKGRRHAEAACPC